VVVRCPDLLLERLLDFCGAPLPSFPIPCTHEQEASSISNKMKYSTRLRNYKTTEICHASHIYAVMRPD
jgi:hypothetical protein